MPRDTADGEHPDQDDSDRRPRLEPTCKGSILEPPDDDQEGES